jgi:hypothetical protein
MIRRLALLAAVLMPVSVYGQTTQQNWPNLVTSGLPTVSVLDDRRVETSGRLLRFTPDSLVLLIDGMERTFEAGHVRRIDRRGDSLKNGAIIGAVVGVVMGALSAGISDCPGDEPGGDCPGFRAVAVFVSTPIYAAIGTGIDALVVGRTRLYDAPEGPTPGAARSQWPNRRTAINVNVRW